MFLFLVGRSPRKETKSESDFLTFLPGVAEASTLLSEGYLKALVDDVAKLPDYWQHFLEDYPGHMVRLRDPHLNRSVGCTLYCA